MTRIGFIGLGTMGLPMARNLIKAGFDVVGHNRSLGPLTELVAAGGLSAATVAETVREADIVATMLPDSPDVLEVLQGEHGAFACARRGTLVVDFSTILPEVAIQLAADGAAGGLRVLDAPVSGGQAGAVEASLSVMVGGTEEDFASALPLFQAVGRTVRRVGPPGAGQLVKAANQLIVAGTIELLAEAIVLLEAHGLDTETALEVLGGGLAGSAVLERKGQGMLARDFRPGFRVELHDKDLTILLAAARRAGVILPLGAVVAQLMLSAKSRGDGGLDHTALLKVVADLSAGRR